MNVSEPRPPSRPVAQRALRAGVHAIRRLFNLHGSAVNNAAASVRADDAARDARDSAADAVAEAEATPVP